MFLKICGIQTPEEAGAAIAAGATAVGVLVGLTHAAEDKVDAATACGIVRAIAGRAEPVLVTHLLDAAEIAALAATIGVRAIQVHDDLPPEGMQRLRGLAPGRRLIKAIHVTGAGATAKAAAYAGVADALLLDSRTADRLGGTGRTHDWTLSRAIAQAAPVPVYLAGGLNPGNVQAAIEAVRPSGVDVNSGVEDKAGAKDAVRMQDFLRAARTALESQAAGA